jgi:hypothetical protein
MAINENKKARKAKNAQKRVLVPFNTGTRSHKSKRITIVRNIKKLISDVDNPKKF